MTIDPPTSQVKDLLGSIKGNFWLESQQAGKSEDEIKQRWASWVQDLTPVLGTTSPVSDIPPEPSIAMTPGHRSNSTPTEADVGAVSMQRRQTDQPMMQQANRPINCPPLTPQKRSSSTYTASQLGDMNAPPRINTSPFNDSEVGSRKMARTSSSRPSRRVANATVYNPAEFLAQHDVTSGHSRSNSQNAVPVTCPNYISGSPVIPSPLSSSYNSVPPLTPDSAGNQSVSVFSPSIGMSRQGSLGGDFRNGFSNTLSLSSKYESEGINIPGGQGPHGPASTHRPSLGHHSALPDLIPEDAENVPNIAVSAPETSPLAMFDQNTPKASDMMKARQGSDGSIAPYDANRRPQASAMERPLKPKVLESEAAQSRLTSHQMIRISSDNGVVTEKYQISKAPVVRPQKEKRMCPHCDKYPNGFRGDHELRRHTKLAHSAIRSAWICVDASEDGQMLSKCTKCRDGKLYGAYYNAAAHLRRVHFCPKQGGRKTRGHSDRGGKGGGDWPPMDELKNKWVKEVENVTNDPMANDDDTEEQELAEQMAQDEVETEDQAHGLFFDNAYAGNLSMSLTPFTVADAGIFGGYGNNFDSMQHFSEELFAFEAPSMDNA